jgi:hypothetical protein
MALSLAKVYSPQSKAITANKRPWSVSYSDIIHSELPTKIEAGRWASDRKLKEKELALTEEATIADIAQSKEAMAQSGKALELQKEQIAAEEEAAKKAEAIQWGSMGLSGAYSLAKLAKDYPWAGNLVGPAAGAGVGYGVSKYTGNKAIGAAAGAGAGAVASYASGGTDMWSMLLSAGAGGLGGLFG